MKKIISLMLSICMLLSITAGLDMTAFAETISGYCGTNITYSFNTETGVLKINGSGNMWDYSGGSDMPEWYDNKQYLKSVDISDGVTKIGKNSFNNCSNIIEINLPDTLTTIGDYAFYSCSSLLNISIPSGVSTIPLMAFSYCYALENVEFGSNLKTIGSGAFFGCHSLKSIVIPNSVTSISNGSFQSCNAVEEVVIPFTGTSATATTESEKTHFGAIFGYSTSSNYSEDYHYSANNKYYTYKIPDTLKRVVFTGRDILPYAFSKCSSIENIIFTDSLTSIGDSAFYNCSKIGNIDFKSNLTNIGAYSFYGCESITKLVIPDSVESVGSYAFYNCPNIIELSIPCSTEVNNFSSSLNLERLIISKGNGTMINYGLPDSDNLDYLQAPWNSNSIKIEELIIEEGVESIGSYAFCYCKNLKELYIPDSVELIGNNAFYRCSNLQSVHFGNRLESIGENAFYECSLLSSVDIPNSVNKIGKLAFYNCLNVSNMNLGNGLTEIGEGAFSCCSGITEITLPTSLRTVKDSAFGNCTGLTKTNYYGTLNQWLNIDFYKISSNPTYNSKHLYINDEKVTELYISGVSKINKYAFSNCKDISKVVITDDVTEIEEGAFYSCSGIKELTMPCSATVNTESGSFFECSNIESVVLTKGNGVMQNYSTYGYAPWYYSKNKVSSIKLADGITNIGDYTFHSCTKITSLEIPETVTEIGTYAIAGCTGLTDLTIPQNVSTIKNLALNGSTNLSKIIILNKDCSIFSSSYTFPTKPILYGYSNSTTEAYSQKYDRKFVAIDDCQHLSTTEKLSTIAPTCEEAGYTIYKCTICATTWRDDYIVPLGHTYGEYISNNDACCEDGTKSAMCSTCGKIDTIIDVGTGRGHIYNVVVTEPTCTQQGYTTYTCIYNDNTYVDDYVDVLNHSFTNYISNNDATCTEDGTKTAKCDRCDENDTIVDVDSATGHQHTEILEYCGPSCTEKGYTEGERCLDCGTTLVYQEEIQPLGHSWDSGVITKNATCSEEGVITYTCTVDVCKATKTEPIAKTAHTQKTVTNTIKPTCIEAGEWSEMLICEVCGEELGGKGDTLPATGHTQVTDKAVAPTCSKTGLTAGSHCSVCGEVIVAQKPIAKTAHSYKNVVTKATTNANGKITPTCSCGATDKATVIYHPKTVTLSKTSYIYDGKVKKPTVTVKDSNGKTISSSNYSVSYSNNTKVGQATVKVTFKGNYSGVISKTFTITPKATTISSVSATSKAFTVKWKKQSTETTGYEIQYSTDKNFKKNNKTVTVSKNSTTSKKVTGLKAKTKYYVHIRTYKTVKVNGKSIKIYSTWSKANVVTTKK